MTTRALGCRGPSAGFAGIVASSTRRGRQVVAVVTGGGLAGRLDAGAAVAGTEVVGPPVPAVVFDLSGGAAAQGRPRVKRFPFSGETERAVA